MTIKKVLYFKTGIIILRLGIINVYTCFTVSTKGIYCPSQILSQIKTGTFILPCSKLKVCQNYQFPLMSKKVNLEKGLKMTSEDGKVIIPF